MGWSIIYTYLSSAARGGFSFLRQIGLHGRGVNGQQSPCLTVGDRQYWVWYNGTAYSGKTQLLSRINGICAAASMS